MMLTHLLLNFWAQAFVWFLPSYHWPRINCGQGEGKEREDNDGEKKRERIETSHSEMKPKDLCLTPGAKYSIFKDIV